MPEKIHPVLILVVAALLLAAGCTQPAADSSRGQAGGTPVTLSAADFAVSHNLDEYMNALFDAGRFSGAVHVARGSTVLLSKGYGMADYEFAVNNTPRTVFPIGSNTKQFTAAAIMKLQEQGRLNVTDPVTLYVPGPAQWKDIRIYNLLNHTSGIPSDGAFSLTDRTDLTLPETVQRIAALPLSFAPGTNYTYSNNGYIVLSAVIENASGMSYEEYLKTNIFLPLGMNSTGQDNARDVFAGRASGYTTMAGKPVHYDLQNIHNSWGAGSVHSTTEDLFSWERSFHTQGTILSQESTAAMIRNHYGIDSAVVRNRTMIGHAGRNFGFISYTLYYPDSDVNIMFLSNYDRTSIAPLAGDLSAIVFGQPYSLPQKLDRKAVLLSLKNSSEYTGTYAPAWEKSWTITVYSDDGRLFYDAVMPGDRHVELMYEGNDTFFVTPESHDSFIFLRDSSGKVRGLEMYTQGSSHDEAVKVS
ncbi:serine hydrolase [Methanoregula sp.]|uniref:serine hydrolase n=1 Tax=Methanoregula sp. TaxID=2052170 RepID=UPI0035652ED3